MRSDVRDRRRQTRDVSMRKLQRVAVLLIAAAAAATLAAPSFALTRDQVRTCESKDDIAAEQRIESCTAIIDFAKSKPQQKAIAYTNRGKAYRDKGKAELAIRDFDRAIELDNHNGEAFYNRGLAFRDRGETGRALREFEQAVTYDKHNANALNILSHIYYDRKDYAHAIDVLDQAIKLNPNFALALFNRGMAFRAKGEQIGRAQV